jgi:hypothetical protein
MGKTIKVRISHQLGAEEAKQRIERGLERVRSQFASHLSKAEMQWTGPHADLEIGFRGQSVRAGLDVAADHVMVSVDLPWLLAPLATAAEKFLTRTGEDVLRIGKA